MAEKQNTGLPTLAKALLRACGPLSLDEVVALARERMPIRAKDPKGSVRTALTWETEYPRLPDGRFDWFPRVAAGATVRVPVTQATRTRNRLMVGGDVLGLFRAGHETHDHSIVPHLRLPGGEIADVILWPDRSGVFVSDLTTVIELPPPFWAWSNVAQRGHNDAVNIRCEDATADQFTVAAVRTASLDREAVEASNEQLRATAITALKQSRGLSPWVLAGRVLAGGAYHRDPPPDPWMDVLFKPPTPLVIERGLQIEYRPEMTPTFWRLFGHRIDPSRVEERMDVLNRLLGLGGRQPKPRRFRLKHLPPARSYLLKVSLQWMPGVWRTIAVRDDHTLEDLHDAIQEAFNWDDDHLYSFFLSGRAWDGVTEAA